jgi:hypothetical protein
MCTETNSAPVLALSDALLEMLAAESIGIARDLKLFN